MHKVHLAQVPAQSLGVQQVNQLRHVLLVVPAGVLAYGPSNLQRARLWRQQRVGFDTACEQVLEAVAISVALHLLLLLLFLLGLLHLVHLEVDEVQ